MMRLNGMDTKYFQGIVPKIIDRDIQKFCKKINYKSKPIYINVNPVKNAIINECFINVNNFIKENDGDIVYGWTIWLHPHCLLEAEFHGIYKDKIGNLVDITPHKNNLTQILFLEDSSLKYEGYSINNIRKNLSNSKLIDECIVAWNEIYNIQNTGENKYKHGKIILDKYQSMRLLDLNRIIQCNLFKFFTNLKLKPNDTCICGSGLKFVDCCKQSVEY